MADDVQPSRPSRVSRRFTEINLEPEKPETQIESIHDDSHETQGIEDQFPQLIDEFRLEEETTKDLPENEMFEKLLYGEKVRYASTTKHYRFWKHLHWILLTGTIYCTNFRIVFSPSAAANVDDELLKDGKKIRLRKPHKILEAAELPSKDVLPTLGIDIPYTRIQNLKRVKHYFSVQCKDGFSADLSFDDEEEAKHISALIASRSLPDHCVRLFAFLHRPPDYQPPPIFDIEKEFSRLGFPNTEYVVDRTLNKNFVFCPSYPPLLVIPKNADSDLLQHVSKFRSRSRIPVGTFRYKQTGACIFRSSQPLVGFGNRSKQDEFYLQFLKHHGQKKLVVLDSRPKTNAQANRLGGGGYEAKKYNVSIHFQDIENIHVVRNTLQALRIAYATPEDKEKISYAESSWLRLISVVLASAKELVVNIAQKSNSVLVHCSDGWDRTAQTISLAEFILDPYYRTIIGFIVLVEKEFVSFGHQFARRHGHGFNIQNPRDSQRSPIFTQFLHCVVQLLRQFPTSFEFNESLLVYVLECIYSCRFGNFLFDNERQRACANVTGNTVSIWSIVLENIAKFQNTMYTPDDEILDISRLRVESISMVPWHEYHKSVLLGHSSISDDLIDPFVEKKKSEEEEN